MPVVRPDHCRGFRSGKAKSNSRCTYCLVAAGVLVRHRLALARHQGYRTDSRSCRIYVLVRAAIATDVLGLASYAPGRGGLLAKLRRKLSTHRGAVPCNRVDVSK